MPPSTAIRDNSFRHAHYRFYSAPTEPCWLVLRTCLQSEQCPRWKRLAANASRRSDSTGLPAKSRWLSAEVDQAHEADDPHPGLVIQRRSLGDGLHAEVLRSGCGWGPRAR